MIMMNFLTFFFLIRRVLTMWKKIFLGTLLLCLLFPLSGSAHAIWINMTAWNPSPTEEGAARTRMYIGWGHRFPVDGLTDRSTFDFIELIDPMGAREKVELEKEGISTAEIVSAQEGAYILSLTRRASIYNTYWEDGQMKRGYGDRADFPNVIESLRTQQFSTAHFRIGSRVASYRPHRAGAVLELVPLADPYAAEKNYVGALLPVQLLLDGAPVPYVEVTATYAGFSSSDAMAQRLLTNQDGIAYVRIVHWGEWLLKAKAERPATEKYQDIADKEVYYTTLTFEI